jgi:hypothetical protein
MGHNRPTMGQHSPNWGQLVPQWDTDAWITAWFRLKSGGVDLPNGGGSSKMGLSCLGHRPLRRPTVAWRRLVVCLKSGSFMPRRLVVCLKSGIYLPENQGFPDLLQACDAWITGLGYLKKSGIPWITSWFPKIRDLFAWNQAFYKNTLFERNKLLFLQNSLSPSPVWFRLGLVLRILPD